MNPHEKVLCVPTDVFGDLDGYESLNRQGFNLHQPSARVKRLREFFVSHGPLWKKRMTCENDTKVQQLIPYVVVTASRSVALSYTRGKSGGESRLHAMRSIGIGGHINPVDVKDFLHPSTSSEENRKDAPLDPLRGLLYTAAMRELSEELDPKRPFIFRNLSVRGFVRTHEAPVAEVHVGIVFEYRCPGGEPHMNPAPEIVEPTFMTAQDIRASAVSDHKKPRSLYEEWSMTLLPRLRQDFAVV